MVWYFWLILFLVCISFVYLLKKVFGAKTYLGIIALIRSEKASKILDKFKHSKFWKWIAKLGIFLGFGFLGILYWYWEDLKYKGNKKYILFEMFFYSILVLITGLLISNLNLASGSKIIYFITLIIFFCFGFAGYVLFLFADQTYLILRALILGRETCPGISPVIPGVKIPGVNFQIPFFEGWIALIIIMFIHELAHGVLARKISVKVKSFGLMLLGIFPIGAFTEPDEDELENAKPKDQMLVYSSGPTINILFAGIIFALVLFLFTPLTSSYLNLEKQNSIEGLYISDLGNYTGICGFGVDSKNSNVFDSLYSQLNINKKDFFENYIVKIDSVNNSKIKSSLEFKTFLNKNSDTNVFNFKLLIYDLNKNSFSYDLDLEKNSDGSFGITTYDKYLDDYVYPWKYSLLMFILITLQWVYLLSFMIGIFNFLPIKPLDGGTMLPIIIFEILPKNMQVRKKNAIIKKITWTIGILFLILIIINILPYFK